MSASRAGALRSLLIGTIASGLLGTASLAQNAEGIGVDLLEAPDGSIVVGGEVFADWGAYVNSDYFRENGLRCGVVPLPEDVVVPEGAEDCAYRFTDPKAEYDPTVRKYRIPVVVHVIRANNGVTGNVPESLVRSQIDILNEDFLALPGTNGEPGTDIQIEFFLATTDPDGRPTNGITYTNNTTWYNDNGTYWNSLAWDPDRYLNIYTNQASGALGYVPFLPQNGSPGSNADRVVVLWSSFGRNAPIGPPYNQGRTATHEVGHYLGLHHTFNNGCGGSDCARSGDYVCDTEPEQRPAYGCPTSRTTCSDPDPVRNYMDYSDDLCMNNFTADQARRMRCTLENYRPLLWQPADEMVLSADPLVGGQSADLSVTEAVPGETVYFVYSLTGTGETPVSALDVTLGLANPVLGGSAVADGNGEAVLTVQVPNVGLTLVWLQTCHVDRVSNVLLTQIN